MQTPFGKGKTIRLKNGMRAVRLHAPCATPGCRNSKVVYVDGMYGYNIHGKMVCNMRDEVYKCRKHRKDSDGVVTFDSVDDMIVSIRGSSD